MPNGPKQTKRDVIVDFDATPVPSGSQSWFLGIGINEYKYFPRLNNAVKDVEDFASLLLEEYDFTPEHTITLYNEDATREHIIEALDRLQKEVGPDDKLLIYYSGHGHFNKDIGKGYWIPTDAERDNTAEYIRNSTVREYMETLRALHTLLISDSCFSGSLFVRGANRSTAAISELASLPSRWALCSGRHDEEVFDGEPGKNSPFAESIMDTLRRNAKREFNVAKLVDRVVEQTRANYNQLPEGNPLFGVGHKGGQYVFRRRAVEAEDWADALAAGALPAFRQFLEIHPDGQHAGEAREKIAFLEEEAAWEKAEAAHTVLAYYEYDQAYPKGRYNDQALDAIAELEEEAAWQEARRRNKLYSYRKYTSDYPQGKHRAEAEAAIETIVAGHEAPAAQPKGMKSRSVAVQPQGERARPAVSPAAPTAAQVKKWLPVAAGALALIVGAVWGISKITGPKPQRMGSAPIGNTVELGGKTYPVIRTKNGVMWMAQNLNYATDDSWLIPPSAYPQAVPYDSGFYGRLYTWEAARKACEAVGWRLPADGDWKILAMEEGGYYNYDGRTPPVGVGNNPDKTYMNLTAGGANGFDAVLGGARVDDKFRYLGTSGTYWSASSHNAQQAYRYLFNGEEKKLYRYYKDKNLGLSCRCVKGGAPGRQVSGEPKPSAQAANQESGPKRQPGASKSENTVAYGGQTYSTIGLEGVAWLGQNLDVEVDGSWCYNGAGNNCDEYGRLYTWKAAKAACESMGMRLPTDEEWHTFHEQFGEQGAYKYLFEGGKSGLNLLTGGYRNPSGQYRDLGESGAYWSGTQAGNGGQSYRYFGFDGTNKKAYWHDRDGQYGYSCRCILDKASEKAKFSGPAPGYVVSVSSYGGELQAQAGVKALMEAGYSAGYLWLPDYSTVSNAEMYLVYIGPFSSVEACGKAVEEYRKTDPNAYGVRIARDRERVEIRGIGKVKRIPNYDPGN